MSMMDPITLVRNNQITWKKSIQQVTLTNNRNQLQVVNPNFSDFCLKYNQSVIPIATKAKTAPTNCHNGFWKKSNKVTYPLN